MPESKVDIRDWLARAETAMAQNQWLQARELLTQAAVWLPRVPQVHHHLSRAQLALGQAQLAVDSASKALALAPKQWQTQLVKGKALKALRQMEAADTCFDAAIHLAPDHGEAFVAKADLAMNVFGLPMQAKDLVQPWLGHSAHGVDAELTTCMASLYDRDMSAVELTQRVVQFSRQHMRLPELHLPTLPQRQGVSYRPRVGIISPLFCNSPVYFLTIAGWRHVAKGSDIVVFSRGHKSDWATDEFRALAKQWVNVQALPAAALAQRIHAEDLDVLYDLGGWMDPVALKALSAQPARAMYKWVGGQSMTTGLDNFDGWIGDEWQSPLALKHLYTEPIVNIPGGYATYTPPPYLPPAMPWHKRRKEWVVFSNPAKLSRKFLAYLRKLEGKVCFVHRQFQYARTQAHVIQALSGSRVTPEFLCPKSHLEALTLLGEFQQMIDTFPYSSGLTAREAQAMGLKVTVFTGELFCERHSLRLSAGHTQLR
jgi:predicted O-linked N-acetylglucosamine transferase (SPINDLY family)